MYEVSLEASSRQILKILYLKGGSPRILESVLKVYAALTSHLSVSRIIFTSWGLIIINAIALTKMLWGVVSGEGSGWVMLGPSLAGLLVCDAVVLYAARRLRMRSSGPSQPASVAATKNPARDPDGAISTSKQKRSHG